MWTILASLTICVAGQVADQPRTESKAKAIAPFVDSGVIAVVQFDLTRGDFPAIVARLSGGQRPSPTADASKALLGWHESLRKAGVRELFLVFNASDMPGLPLAVVPLARGADAAEIGRLFCGGGDAKPPVHFPACATLHNAVTAGTATALDRVRTLAPHPRPELADAFAALDDATIGLRLLIVPSAETRRVFEETVPNLPRELGGGPITEFTRSILWAALGLDAGPRPSFKLVVASPNDDAARSLQRIGQSLVAILEKSPQMQGIMPEFPKLAAQVKAEIAADRLIVTADAQVAADMIDSVLRPAREAAIRAQCTNNEKQIALAVHNYIAMHNNAFPPAYITDKAGKPLLSWRVLILPYLEQEALFKEFHLDEPWDSEHNRSLIARMPQVYRCPSESGEAASQGKTRYVAPRGPGTIFWGAEPVKLKEITDGTSNTIMFVDAGDERAVTWTKPDDWHVPPDDGQSPAMILRAHGDRKSKGTNCAFADGSVRFLRETIKPGTLRALLTFAGNEVISSDDE